MELLDETIGFDSFFSLFFTIIVIVIVLMIGYGLVNWILNLTADKVRVEATLISKDSHTSHHNNGDSMNSHTSHSFTFETTYGERVILDVSYKMYRQYAVGDFGELEYQRRWLKKFTLKSK